MESDEFKMSANFIDWGFRVKMVAGLVIAHGVTKVVGA